MQYVTHARTARWLYPAGSCCCSHTSEMDAHQAEMGCYSSQGGAGAREREREKVRACITPPLGAWNGMEWNGGPTGDPPATKATAWKPGVLQALAEARSNGNGARVLACSAAGRQCTDDGNRCRRRHRHWVCHKSDVLLNVQAKKAPAHSLWQHGVGDGSM